VSVNEPRKGRAFWAIARMAAVPVIALVVAGVALPQILDSGPGRLPSFGLGSSPGSHSGSGAGPVAKVVVPPLRTATPPHHRSAKPAHSTPTARPTTTASGSSRQATAGRPTAKPVSRPVHHSSGGRKQPTPTPTPTPTRSAGGGTGSVVTPPATQLTPAAAGQNDEGNRSSHGLALGHHKHESHVPPGQLRKAENPPPRGLALGHRTHVPPGQARKAERSSESNDDDQGESSRGNSDHKHSSHGRGHGG
jgi:hypothetical protein